MNTHHQQWDIVSGVGLTALGVAAGRAVETHRDNRLMSDPYAENFVRAADPPTPMPTGPAEIGHRIWDHMSTYMGLRSRFFDDYFASTAKDQVVVLAAGLDARAYRLSWPDGCTVFEVDQPKVLEFKQRVLDDAGAAPACVRQVVATDLRDDWVAALKAAGFDPGKPTAWLAEGLLPYLPAKAEEELFERVHALSAPGSAIAVEKAGPRDAEEMRNHPLFKESSEQFGVDIGSLWNSEARRDCVEWLRSAGWDVLVEPVAEAAKRYDRALHPEISDVMGRSNLVTARK